LAPTKISIFLEIFRNKTFQQLNVDKSASTVSWDRILHLTKSPHPCHNNNPENKRKSEKKGTARPPIEFIQVGI